MTEIEVKQMLERANFELKMKVFYLEEKLKRLLHTDLNDYLDCLTIALNPSNGFPSSVSYFKSAEGIFVTDSDADNLISVQILSREIEQKNRLLIKAKAAIDSLKIELERYRASELLHKDIENRLQGLKNENEAVEIAFNQQVSEYKNQISELQRLITQGDVAYNTTNQNLKHVEGAYEDLFECYKSISAELIEVKRSEQALRDSTMGQDKLLKKLKNTVETLKNQCELQEVEIERLNQRLVDVTAAYESVDKNYQTLKSEWRNDDAIKKLSAKNLEDLEAISVKHQDTLNNAKLECDKRLSDIRSIAGQEIERFRAECNSRCQEISSRMELESKNVISLTNELESQRLRYFEQLRLQTEQLTEANRKLVIENLGNDHFQTLLKDIERYKVNVASLQECLRQEKFVNEELSQTITKLKNEKESFADNATLVQNELRHLQNKLLIIDAELNESQKENCKLQAEVDTLTAQLRSYCILSNAQTQDFKTLQVNHETVRQKLSKAITMIKILQDEQESLYENLDRYRTVNFHKDTKLLMIESEISTERKQAVAQQLLLQENKEYKEKAVAQAEAFDNLSKFFKALTLEFRNFLVDLFCRLGAIGVKGRRVLVSDDRDPLRLHLPSNTCRYSVVSTANDDVLSSETIGRKIEAMNKQDFIESIDTCVSNLIQQVLSTSSSSSGPFLVVQFTAIDSILQDIEDTMKDFTIIRSSFVRIASSMTVRHQQELQSLSDRVALLSVRLDGSCDTAYHARKYVDTERRASERLKERLTEELLKTKQAESRHIFELKQLQGESDELKKDLSSARKELESLNEKYKLLHKEYAALEGKYKMSLSEGYKLTRSIGTPSPRISHHLQEDKGQGLQAEVRALSSEKVSLLEKLLDLRKAYTNQSNEVLSLKKDLESFIVSNGDPSHSTESEMNEHQSNNAGRLFLSELSSVTPIKSQPLWGSVSKYPIGEAVSASPSPSPLLTSSSRFGKISSELITLGRKLDTLTS